MTDLTLDEKQCEELIRNLRSTVDQAVAFSQRVSLTYIHFTIFWRDCNFREKRLNVLSLTRYKDKSKRSFGFSLGGW